MEADYKKTSSNLRCFYESKIQTDRLAAAISLCYLQEPTIILRFIQIRLVS